MLKFYVIIDFIDYQFLLIINTIRSVNLHRLVVIFYAFYFQSRFPKHGFFMHKIMVKTATKLWVFHSGDWYIMENMGIRFYRTIAEWQRITNTSQDNYKPAVNYIHFLTCLLYAPLLWQTSNKMIAEAYPRFSWVILIFITIQYNFRADSSPVISPSPD